MTAPILKTINNANNCHQLGKEENTHTHAQVAQVTGNYRFATANEIILQSFSQLDNQYKKKLPNVKRPAYKFNLLQ